MEIRLGYNNKEYMSASFVLGSNFWFNPYLKKILHKKYYYVMDMIRDPLEAYDLFEGNG